jgi:hypothetical protein
VALQRIIYKSEATLPIDLDVVLSIAEESEERNRRLGITGLLLATDGHFLQVLEGEQRPLDKVYLRITKDKRHTTIKVISRGPVERREFDGWGMKGVGLMGYADELCEFLRGKYGVDGDEVLFPEEESVALAFLADVRRWVRRG